jgi:predicted metal-dependent enzyme (double-stranded beta helix superfamily)
MWAVIGIYTGCEQNVFYQRAERGLKQHGSKELHAKEAVPLGAAMIHAVTNPLDHVTAAIHVYGGDFFATPRSEWDPESFEERPYDVGTPCALLRRRKNAFAKSCRAPSRSDYNLT